MDFLVAAKLRGRRLEAALELCDALGIGSLAALRARREGGGPGVRPHCRFRNRGAEYVSERGMKRMRGRTKRPCDPEP
jgi:hypothetical protein